MFSSCICCMIAVHPRVCGEQIPHIVVFCLFGGSSPRVRGTVGDIAAGAQVPRFIPACAGNRVLLLNHYVSPPVHHRVCGEQQLRVGILRTMSGSSPRVRGTVQVPHQKPPVARFIPACAGNSLPSQQPARPKTVHPRVCGEQRNTKSVSVSSVGSSPRVRGTGWMNGRVWFRTRFIPACAGNSRR